MEACRIVAGKFALQKMTGRVGTVIEVDFVSGGVLIKWHDTGDEEAIPAHTIEKTWAGQNRPADEKNT